MVGFFYGLTVPDLTILRSHRDGQTMFNITSFCRLISPENCKTKEDTSVLIQVKYLHIGAPMDKIQPQVESRLYSYSYKILLGIAIVYLYFF
jgi:hypothetical protein